MISTRALYPFLVVVALLVGRAATAQGVPPVSGEWTVVWDMDITSRDGKTAKVNRRGTATLSLVQRGDSVTGRWVDGLLSETGRAADGVRVHGIVRGDTVAFATDHIDDGRAGVRLSFVGARRSDRLGGTMFVRIGSLVPAPRRWEGSRSRP